MHLVYDRDTRHLQWFRLDHATPEDNNLVQSVVNEEEEWPVKPGCMDIYKDKYSLTIFTQSNHSNHQW